MCMCALDAKAPRAAARHWVPSTTYVSVTGVVKARAPLVHVSRPLTASTCHRCRQSSSASRPRGAPRSPPVSYPKLKNAPGGGWFGLTMTASPSRGSRSALRGHPQGGSPSNSRVTSPPQRCSPRPASPPPDAQPRLSRTCCRMILAKTLPRRRHARPTQAAAVHSLRAQTGHRLCARVLSYRRVPVLSGGV